MLGHLRANLWLLGMTVLGCCVLYPLILWGVAQGTLFRDQAEGSLIYDKEKKIAVGSRLIAQAFDKPEFFQPRPSAPSFNASTSGPSNLGANNYKLRDNVARRLGPIVKYAGGDKKGKLVAGDIVTWFRTKRPGLVGEWAEMHPNLAQEWVKADEATKKFALAWLEKHPDEVNQWKKDNPKTPSPEATDLAVVFFQSFSKENPGTWLALKEKKTPEGETEKYVELVTKEAEDIPAVFFDLWRQAHPVVELEEVPADLVMSSGSGLDPHITVANALYQAPRVAEARAKLLAEKHKIPEDFEDTIHKDLVQFIHERAESQLFGLVGVPLVNVLELNLALQERMDNLVKKLK